MTIIEYHLPQEIRQEFRINDQGQAFASIRGAARLLDLSHTTLIENFNTARSENGVSHLAKSLMDKGFQVVGFSETGIPDTAFVVICEYYAFEAGKRCTEQAKLVYRAFAAMGFRTWVQQELGWRPSGIPMTLAEVVAAQSQILVQQEQQIKELTYAHEDFQKAVDDIEYRFRLFESQQQEATNELLDRTPWPNVHIPTTTRELVHCLVNNYVKRTALPHAKIWNHLYTRFRLRCKFDARLRAKYQNVSPMDAIEAAGLMDAFYGVAHELLWQEAPKK